MNKKELVVPFIFVGLAIVFAIICFIVFFNNGKSAKWVSRKMLVGGLLLSLMTFPETGCHRNTLCYKFAPPINKFEDAEVKFKKVKSNKLTGYIKRPKGIYYLKKGYKEWEDSLYDDAMLSDWLIEKMTIEEIKANGPAALKYEIFEFGSNNIVCKGELIPVDGKFNSEAKEDFEIVFKNKLKKGAYNIKICYTGLLGKESFDYPDPFKIEIHSEIIKVRK